MYKRIILLWVILISFAANLTAQKITGQVRDAATGEGIPMAYVHYKDHNLGVQSDIDGRFTIDRKVGWKLTVTFMGYKTEEVSITKKTPNRLIIKLKENTSEMAEVVVKAEKKRYSRKNNPAVDLMRRVVEAKKRTHLENHDYYQYTKYQKISLALNDYKTAVRDSDSVSSKKFNWNERTEISPYNHKVIMPLMVDETVKQHVYRKSPRAEKDIIHGQNSSGVNQLFVTGDMVNTALKEVFQDIDIY